MNKRLIKAFAADTLAQIATNAGRAHEALTTGDYAEALRLAEKIALAAPVALAQVEAYR